MREKPVVSVVLPSYNEEGLLGFLIEIEAWLRPATSALTFVVVDDCSTTPMALTAARTTLPLGSVVLLTRNEANRGHGPTAVAAYRHGLSVGPDVVIHVDGDGQFVGEDFPRLLEALGGYDGVVGARAGRREPWFRRVLSAGARICVGNGFTGSDANSPLRAYREAALQRLLPALPDSPLVPHLHFAVLHSRLGLEVREIEVAHRPRRGDSETGTTWQGQPLATILPSRRLLSLAWGAWRELRVQRASAPTLERLPRVTHAA